jgi:hypothetical protein
MVADVFNRSKSKGDTWSNTPFGRNYIGERKTGRMIAEEILSPMSWTPMEIQKSIEANGVSKAAALQALNLLGVSVSNYEELDKARR